MLDIKITKTTHPKEKPQDESKLGFGKKFSDHMFLMDYTAGEGWHDARIVPYGPWEMDPATTVFHYAQEIFEGMKAYRTAEGKVQLFRPECNMPFNPKGNIAVIGPLANSRSNMPGTWSVAAVLDRCPSLVEGLKEMTAGKANIMYAKGSNLISDASYEERATMFGRSLNRDNRTDQQLLDEALNVARRSDIIIAALGESSEMSGESSSRTDLNIPDVQQNLLKELLKTGKPVVLVLFTGRPLTLNWEQEHVPAILNVWFGGSEAAYAIGDALFGYVNPGEIGRASCRERV